MYVSVCIILHLYVPYSACQSLYGKFFTLHSAFVFIFNKLCINYNMCTCNRRNVQFLYTQFKKYYSWTITLC